MINNKVWKGVNDLLDNYLKINSNDKIIIFFTPDSYQSAVWVSAAIEMRNIKLRRIPMLPINDKNFSCNIASAINEFKATIGKLFILTFEKDTMSHTSELIAAVKQLPKEKYQIYRVISASKDFFSKSLTVTPEELTKINTTILTYCMNAKFIKVTTKSGSDIKFELDSSKYEWISNRGEAKPGKIVILPAGEVATYPVISEGKFIADFAFNVNTITNIDPRLDKNPVILEIANNKVEYFYCSNPIIMDFLKECFNKNCAFNVGELGFGTNFGIKKPVAFNSHINERKPGIHIGFGQHNQGNKIEHYCNIHLDLIANGGQVWIDDKHYFDLENVLPSNLNHPSNEVRDEDVFSPNKIKISEVDDCCGIIS